MKNAGAFDDGFVTDVKHLGVAETADDDDGLDHEYDENTASHTEMGVSAEQSPACTYARASTAKAKRGRGGSGKNTEPGSGETRG